VRRALDTLYRAALWASALCLVAIALTVGAQLFTRLLDGALALLHLPRTDFVILSLNEICGYLLAAASFLALAGTLKAGAHIRVTMVLSSLGKEG
jgi:TRAP-type C4-dicarboxylate transport system permease small subunit